MTSKKQLRAAQNAAQAAADHAEAKADDAVNAAEAAAAKAEDKVQDEAKSVEDAATKAEDKAQDEVKAAEDAATKAEDKAEDEVKAAEDAATKAEDKAEDEVKAAEDAAAKAEDKAEDEVKAAEDAAAQAEAKAQQELKAAEDAAAQAEAKAEAAVKAAAANAQAALKAAEAAATRAVDTAANSALGAAAAAAALGDVGGPVADDAKDTARDRDTKLTLRMGDEQFNLLSLTASEGLSQPFLITIDVLSELGAFDLMPHLGSEAIVENLRDGEHMRYFHGVVTDGHLVGEAVTGTQKWSEGAHHYRLTLRPKAYFHSHGRDFRIYQDKSVLDIIKDVLERTTIDYEDKQQDNVGASRSLKYCVQFGESDMAFVYRLMEEHGIYYFYRHDKDKHVMVLCDAPGSHGKLATPDLRYHPYAASIANFGSAARARCGADG